MSGKTDIFKLIMVDEHFIKEVVPIIERYHSVVVSFHCKELKIWYDLFLKAKRRGYKDQMEKMQVLIDREIEELKQLVGPRWMNL